MKVYEAKVYARALSPDPAMLERITRVEVETGLPWLLDCHFFRPQAGGESNGMIRVQYTYPLNGSKWAEAEVPKNLVIEQVLLWE